jgi:chaperone modulatory protein CbpM
MIAFKEIVERFAELEAGELTRWVENRWIVPEAEDKEAAERWSFHEVDVARVELILDIRREFALDEETMSLVLGLLDQVYSLRRQMRRLCQALENQPPEIRDAIRRALPAASTQGQRATLKPSGTKRRQ